MHFFSVKRCRAIDLRLCFEKAQQLDQTRWAQDVIKHSLVNWRVVKGRRLLFTNRHSGNAQSNPSYQHAQPQIA